MPSYPILGHSIIISDREWFIRTGGKTSEPETSLWAISLEFRKFWQLKFKLLSGLQNNYLLMSYRFKTVFLQLKLPDGLCVLTPNFRLQTGSRKSTKAPFSNPSTWMKDPMRSSRTFKILSKEVVHVCLKTLIKNLTLLSTLCLKRTSLIEPDKNISNLPITLSIITSLLNCISPLNSRTLSTLLKSWVRPWSSTSLSHLWVSETSF